MEDVRIAAGPRRCEELIREALALLASDDVARVEEIVHPDYRDHTLHGLVRGLECFRALRLRLRRAFADIELIPHDVIMATTWSRFGSASAGCTSPLTPDSSPAAAPSRWTRSISGGFRMPS